MLYAFVIALQTSFLTVIIPIMCASKSDRYPMSTTLDWNKPTRLMSPWPGSTEGQLWSAGLVSMSVEIST